MVIDSPSVFKLDEVEQNEKALDQTVVVQSKTQGLMGMLADSSKETQDAESQNDRSLRSTTTVGGGLANKISLCLSRIAMCH